MNAQIAHSKLDCLIARRLNGSGMDDRDSVMPEAIEVLLGLLKAAGHDDIARKFDCAIAETTADVEALQPTAPAPRPSLPLTFETGIKVGYSDHYLTELGHARRDAKLRDRWGIVRSYSFYDADERRVPQHDPNGVTIANVAWAADYRRVPVDPEDEGSGVHYLNLTKLD